MLFIIYLCGGQSHFRLSKQHFFKVCGILTVNFTTKVRKYDLTFGSKIRVGLKKQLGMMFYIDHVRHFHLTLELGTVYFVGYQSCIGVYLFKLLSDFCIQPVFSPCQRTIDLVTINVENQLYHIYLKCA